MADSKQPFEGEESLSEDNIHVSLTYDPLDSSTALARVKSPKAGAVVLFAGTRVPLELYRRFH
jgi:molybdopterin synthase catalytic subunit